MIRSALRAGLRHLLQNRSFAAISVGGLAIGLCAALLAGAVIRSQYTVDHDVPGYDRTYAALWFFAAPGMTPQYSTLSMLTLADDPARAVVGCRGFGSRARGPQRRPRRRS